MPTGTAQELKQLGIGRKIRALREAKGLALDALAEHLVLPQVVLAQIEAEVVPPTVATLLNISKILGVGIDHFFADGEDTGRIEITRPHERLTVHHDDLPDRQSRLSYTYESLAYRLAKKHMEPFFVEFDNTEASGPPWSHDGEEFVYVLEGELDFISGDDHLRLSTGDSVYFHAHVPHMIRAVGAGKAKAIIVLYPFAS
jgi:quercetin dioxygenase-like cupin family protein/DNA-binding XRE family transcriptional regulator